MDIICRLNRKYEYLRHKLFLRANLNYSTIQLQSAKVHSPVIYYFCTPIHSNLGDQAQLVCIKKWFANNYPDYTVVELCARSLPIDWITILKNQIQATDLIFIHSGYLFMNNKSDVPVILDLVKNFRENKIVFLPQTVNFSNEEVKETFLHTFSEHPNLVLLCRDFVSYDMAKIMFSKNTCLAFPDVVTSLVGTYTRNYNRTGVCFCLRDDQEKFYSDKQLQNLIDNLKDYGYTRIDTTLKISPFTMNNHREKLIYKTIDHIAGAKVVITDRYHGTIFSIIANTPVIVINSTDHKLSSGVKWFPSEIFGKAIQYASTLDEAYSLAKDILDGDYVELHNPPYLLETYWSKLKEQL